MDEPGPSCKRSEETKPGTSCDRREKTKRITEKEKEECCSNNYLKTMDEEEDTESPYENGHWEWDERNGGLAFMKNIIADDDNIAAPVSKVVGPIEFKDDIDLYEQQRFRKRYQRKAADDAIVTLQDVKDVVLFTAPLSILSVSVINMLHLPMTERFLRALIFFCQYYLQTADEMSSRALEQLVKVRTPDSHKTELKYQENMEDLRLLVAKEYLAMITGAEGYQKYHHMGPQKKRRSLSKKDALLFETILRIAIQMVWVALGRKYLHKIEVEVHRIFKSPIFNMVEHKLHTGFDTKMSPEERTVLLGHCVRRDMKLNTRSPLMNEFTCDREISFKLLGLGVLKFHKLSIRLHYLERVLVASEESFDKLKMTLGIIGMPRSMFDTMLRELPHAAGGASSGSIKSCTSRVLSSKSSRPDGVKSSIKVPQNVYPEIVLPEKHKVSEHLPKEFPSKTFENKPCSNIQRSRWLARLGVSGKRLSHKPSVKKK